jgi:hypothetical protein
VDPKKSGLVGLVKIQNPNIPGKKVLLPHEIIFIERFRCTSTIIQNEGYGSLGAVQDSSNTEGGRQ